MSERPGGQESDPRKGKSAKTTSTKRIRANRRNARKSTGPRTSAGKSRSKMNALKHGLDAQTLILPGEDEAAFNDRLAAWRADLKPRDEAEESMIAEAARLSWVLDRADRAEAAAAVARLADLDDRARRQAEEEAAEAEAIGRRLLDGPPVVPAPAGVPADEAAARRFRAWMHPDDPDHPARLLRRLEATAAGCRWLLDRWEELGADLWDGEAAGWRPDRRLMAVRLLGKAPIDALDDPIVQRIYLCSFVLGGEDPHVLSDQAEEMTKEHFRLFLGRLKARGAMEAMPSDRAAALRGLRGLVAGMLARLEQQAARDAEHAEVRAALAPAMEAIDISPEGDRRHRLQYRIANAFYRSVDLLNKERRLHKPARRRPDVAASPDAAEMCEEIRNEPNAPAGSAQVGRAFQPDSGGSDPDRIGPSQARMPDLHRPDHTDTNSQPTSVCNQIRNEPNADGSDPVRSDPPRPVSAVSALNHSGDPLARRPPSPGISIDPAPNPSPGSH